MAYFDLSTYETVEERLAKFWETFPNGRVLTEIVHYDEKRVLIKASLWKDRKTETPDSTGFAEEVFGSSPVNKTSFVENCETSAIGRAAANMNLSAKGKRPSREEMAKAQRRSEPQETTEPAPAQPKNSGAVRQAKPAQGKPETMITGAQAKYINDKALFLKLNPTEYISAVLGRELKTLTEVRAVEMGKVLKALASTEGGAE